MFIHDSKETGYYSNRVKPLMLIKILDGKILIPTPSRNWRPFKYPSTLRPCHEKIIIKKVPIHSYLSPKILCICEQQPFISNSTAYLVKNEGRLWKRIVCLGEDHQARIMSNRLVIFFFELLASREPFTWKFGLGENRLGEENVR